MRARELLGKAALWAALALVIVDAARAATPNAVPRFEASECPKPQSEALANARCGYLVVPEDRSKPTGRTLRLVVAIVPALAAKPAPDPVVYLVGGPGGIALGEAGMVIAAGFNRDRDLVLMNQRGTFQTDPELTCPSVDKFARELIGQRFYSAATEATHLAATEACRRALGEKNVELSAYNSTESAADFADLRAALGFDAYNVLGVSYGTFLAQVLMRDHPEGIRSVVLDSVVPMTVSIPGFWDNTRIGFQNLFRACVEEAACNAAHPELEKTFTDLVRKLEREPLAATVGDPATGAPVKVLIDGGALVDWLRNQSYSTPLLRSAPNLIDGFAKGRPDSIEAIARDRAGRAPPPAAGNPSVGYGLSFGVVCREWYPAATQAEWEIAGRQAFPDYPATIQDQAVGTWAYSREDCPNVWRVPAAPKAMHEPLASSIPTLLISGSFDAVTSDPWARAAATDLSKATIISLPGIGHFASPQSPCAQAVIASFLAEPDGPPDLSCVAGLSPPAFAAAPSP